MWFAEVKTFDGRWSPATFSEDPRKSGPYSRKPGKDRIRAVRDVPESLRKLDLDALAHVYGQEGKFRGTAP